MWKCFFFLALLAFFAADLVSTQADTAIKVAGGALEGVINAFTGGTTGTDNTKESCEKATTILSEFKDETGNNFSNLETRCEKPTTILSEFKDETGNNFSNLETRHETLITELSDYHDESTQKFSNLVTGQEDLKTKLLEFQNEAGHNFTNLETRFQQHQQNQSYLMKQYFDNNGEWTTILHRQDGPVVIKKWDGIDFINGFGEPDADFFIGVEKIHKLTTNGDPQELLIVVKDYADVRKTARCDKFRIGNADQNYQTLELGTCSGAAADLITIPMNVKFNIIYKNKNAEIQGALFQPYYNPQNSFANLAWTVSQGNVVIVDLKIRAKQESQGFSQLFGQGCSQLLEKCLDDNRDIMRRQDGSVDFYRTWKEYQNRFGGFLEKYLDDNREWDTIMRRQDGSVDFYRTWKEYQNGFGDPDGEFFIGLDKLHNMTTRHGTQELLIVMKNFDNIERTARYDKFKIGNAEEKYQLLELGTYSGDAGDSLSGHKNKKFSTHDNYNDGFSYCASYFKGAWWFYKCYNSHLFGPYKKDIGVSWNSWNYGLKFAEMKIRSKFN